MAMFHFRLKSDKKPDGTRISAVQHVDYIRHEGNFAEDKQWQENNKFVGNFISSTEIKNACKDFNSLLYKTDNFGSIRNTAQGIEVTEKASLTTIAVALMLADETMKHKPLIISGSKEFIRKVLDTAIFENLPISFADKKIQTELRRQKEKKEIERINYIASGGKIFTERPNSQPSTPEEFACLHCPNSIWFIQNQNQLTCYCRLMNLVSWTNSQRELITMCDGIFLSNS